MLRRWCSTSTPDASLNVLYKSCLSFTAQGKTIHDSRGRVQSYSLLQTGDVQWCEAVSVVWPLACSPRLTCWALWFSMSRCLLHMEKGSLPMEGFQRWGSQLQGFGTKKNTGHSRELKTIHEKGSKVWKRDFWLKLNLHNNTRGSRSETSGSSSRKHCNSSPSPRM